MGTADDVIAVIRRAFAGVVRPDFTLADAEVDDDAAAAADVEERHAHWWELDDGYIERMNAALCLLPSQSVPYYLAAYMTWAVRTYASPPAGATDDLGVFLTRHDQVGAVTAVLTRDQRVAIATFVAFMSAAEHRRLVDEGFVEPELRELNYYRQAFEDVWRDHLAPD